MSVTLNLGLTGLLYVACLLLAVKLKAPVWGIIVTVFVGFIVSSFIASLIFPLSEKDSLDIFDID